MLQKPNLIFVTSVTMKIKVTTPKQIGFLGGLWGNYVPGFNLTAVIVFELLCGNECLIECDVCDREIQGHDPKTNMSLQGPMGKLHIRFQFDSCNTF